MKRHFLRSTAEAVSGTVARIRRTVAAIEHGREPLNVPPIEWQFSLRNLVTQEIAVLGRFHSPLTGIVFCVSGQVTHGGVFDDTLLHESRARFFPLTAEQVATFLSAHRLRFHHRHTPCELFAEEVDLLSGVTIEVVQEEQ